MVMAVVLFWMIGALIALIPPRRPSTFWLGAAMIGCGAGGIPNVLDQLIYPLLSQTPINKSTVYYIHYTCKFILNFFSPCAFFIFTVNYAALFKRQVERWLVQFLAAVFVLMAGLVPFAYRFDFYVPVITSWWVLFVFSGICLLLYSWLKEKTPVVRQQRLYTNFVFVPTGIVVLFVKLTFPALTLEELWDYYYWIIFGVFIMMFVSLMRAGFLGMKITPQVSAVGENEAALQPGNALLEHALKNDSGKLKLFIHKLKQQVGVADQQDTMDDIQVMHRIQESLDETITKLKYAGEDIPLEFRTESLQRMLEEVLAELAPRLEQTRLVRDWDPERPVNVYGDDQHLKEVFTNVIVNALEAMPLSGTLEIRMFVDQPFAVVEIKDSGPGMTRQVRKKAFEKYFTTKSDGRKNFGLGLYCY